MMTDLYLDENHDIDIKDRDLRLTDETEDVAQRLRIRLQFLLGEWFINTSKGIPFTQTIIEAGRNDLDTVYAILRKEISNTDGVTEINDLELDFKGESRELTVNLAVNNTINVEVTI